MTVAPQRAMAQRLREGGAVTAAPQRSMARHLRKSGAVTAALHGLAARYFRKGGAMGTGPSASIEPAPRRGRPRP